jgi:hypothetical protein
LHAAPGRTAPGKLPPYRIGASLGRSLSARKAIWAGKFWKLQRRLGCFDRTVCAQATFRVWDMLFLEGSAVLLRTGLAIFR